MDSKAEQALLHRLQRHEHHPLARNHGMSVLREYPQAAQCRLIVEAILSNVFVPVPDNSGLCDQAHEWIGQQTNTALIAAVALLEASYSKERYSIALVSIFDRHEIELSPEANQLKKCASEGKIPEWSEIKRAVGLTEWEPMPQSNRYDLYSACNLVASNQRLELRWMKACQLISVDGIAQGTELPSQILDLALLQSREVAELFFLDNFDALSPHFFSKLTIDSKSLQRTWYRLEAEYDDKDDAEKAKQNYVSNLTLWMELLSQRFGNLGPSTQKEGLEALISLPARPWVAIHFSNLIPYIEDWSELPEFFHSWRLLIRPDQEEDVFMCGEGGLRYRVDLAWVQFCSSSDGLIAHPDTAIRYLALYLGSYSDFELAFNRTSKGEIRLFTELQAHPELLQTHLASHLVSHNTSPWLMDAYIQCVGWENSKPTFLDWLNHTRNIRSLTGMLNDSRPPKNLLIRRVISHSLAILQYFPDCGQDLSEAGYALQCEDVDSVAAVVELLELDPQTQRCSACLTSDYRRSVSYIIHNKQWLSCLLSRQHSLLSVWEAILTCTYSNDKACEYLDAVIDKAEWKDSHEWQRCLCHLAWDLSAYSMSGHEARRILRSRKLWTRADAKIHWSRVQEYLRIHNHLWSRDLGDSPKAFFTPAELLDLFFETVLRQRDSRECLGLPKSCEWLFLDSESRQRLYWWLMSNRSRIESENWLQWVKYFGFSSEPSVQRAAYAVLEKAYHGYSSDDELATLALSIINPSLEAEEAPVTK